MGKRKKGKQTGGNDEDNNVNADGIPATSIAIFQKVHEIMVKFSELEIYAVLVECDMDENEAINRLLDTEQHSVVINQGENSIQNSELRNGGGHDVDQGGEHKLNSEASTEQGIRNQLAALSTTSSVLVPHNSDLTNGETKSSDEAVPSLSVPSSSGLNHVKINRVPISSGKEVRYGRPFSPSGPTFAAVVKMGFLLPSKESVTEGIVKDDSRSYEKPDASNPSSQTDAARDQLGESANLQMQNSFACPGDIVLQRPYTSEQNSQCLNSFFDWSRPTSQSIPERQVPSEQYGNQNDSYSIRSSTFQKCVGRNNNTLAHVMNSPNSRPEYNNIPASSAFQQHDGSNNNTYFYHQSLESMFSQDRNSNQPQSDTSIGSSSYDFGTSSGNAANSRFGYGDVLRNHLPSVKHQSGEFSYSHWRSPNFRPSQQEQQSYTRIGDERSITTSQNQQNSTSDPSHQTQQGSNGYGEEDDRQYDDVAEESKQEEN